MTDTPKPWDRLPYESAKAYDAFRTYCGLGAKRSIATAIQKATETLPSGSQLTQWKRWSAKYKWVHRNLAREEWIARTSDEQIIANLTACKLALTMRAHDFLTASDGPDFLRAARALALHFPPVQRVEDVSERFEDLSDLPDEALDRMREIRDAARRENTTKFEGRIQ